MYKYIKKDGTNNLFFKYTFSEDASEELEDEEEESDKEDKKKKKDKEEKEGIDKTDKEVEEAEMMDGDNEPIDDEGLEEAEDTDTDDDLDNTDDSYLLPDDDDMLMDYDPDDTLDNYDASTDTQLDDSGQPIDEENLEEDVADEVSQNNKIIRKIQTTDVLTKIMDKYISYVNKLDVVTINNLLPSNQKKTSLVNWDYVEDMHKLLNTVLGNQNFEYLNVYNNFYDKMTMGEWKAGLEVYSIKNFQTPFITEAMYILLYELSIDWATFVIGFLKNNPEINVDDFENDSFVRKYPNLTLLTYIAKLLSESDEFNDFMTNEEAFKLITDKDTYNISMKQVKQKSDMIKTAGESLTYYANLVQHNYADILVGVLDKLGAVLFLYNNCEISFVERLNIISELVKSSVEQTTTTSLTDSYALLYTMADKIVLARAEARLLLDSDKNNYIMRIEQ